jgi:hypothetical protein
VHCPYKVLAYPQVARYKLFNKRGARGASGAADDGLLDDEYSSAAATLAAAAPAATGARGGKKGLANLPPVIAAAMSSNNSGNGSLAVVCPAQSLRCLVRLSSKRRRAVLDKVHPNYMHAADAKRPRLSVCPQSSGSAREKDSSNTGAGFATIAHSTATATATINSAAPVIASPAVESFAGDNA